MDHLFSETCVLSLASSQTGEQLRSKKLYESSPHCMLWHWRSPQDEMQFQGETKGNGELHLRGLSRKSEYIFWSVSINQSINIKTIPWNLTALQELHSKPSKHHCTVTFEKALQADDGLCAGKQARRLFFLLTCLTCCWIMWPSGRWFLSQLIHCVELLRSVASNSIWGKRHTSITRRDKLLVVTTFTKHLFFFPLCCSLYLSCPPLLSSFYLFIILIISCYRR